MEYFKLNVRFLLLILCLQVALESCSSLKTKEFFESGEVSQSQFDKNFSFSLENGLIIIEVEIKDKSYNFLLDSGAPNVISKEIATELNLPIQFSSAVYGSQNKRENLEFVKIDTISIAGINFNNTGAIVAELEKGINKVACFTIDGIIGANLMKKAIWDINYESQFIRIVSNKKLLKIGSSSNAIPFVTDVSGSPLIKIEVNDFLSVEVEVDLGMQGDFSLLQAILKKINKAENINKIYGFGTLSGSLFGYAGPEKDEFAMINSVGIGSTRLSNQIVTFINTAKTQKIGTKFLKNYRVIFDWFNKELHLIKEKEYDNNEEIFGIKFRFIENNEVIVSYVFENSDAFRKGLKFGDKVVALDGENLQGITKEKWCTLKKELQLNESNYVNLTISIDNINTQYSIKNGLLFNK